MSGHDSKYFSTTKKGEIPELKEELNSQYKDKRKDAVKKVIAAMTVGKDESSLFTDVLNCMQTENLELKKLVYLYLINYAKSQPDLAILADSQDPNPLIRALAVRTMGCIRVDKITEYLCDTLQRCLKDDDPYVRKTAAICVAKLYDINAELVEDRGFLEALKDLISDNNPMVVANAVAALAEIQDNSSKPIFDLTTSTLTKLLTALNECTEWGQVFILDALSKYKASCIDMRKYQYTEMLCCEGHDCLLAYLNTGAQKKRVRGYTRKTETWNMSNSHKILVTFNEFDKPIGDEGNELTQYLGTLVRMPNHVGVDYDDWRMVPIQKKEDMYTMVKAKFVIHPEETPEIKSWIFYSMGKKWRTWKASLKARFYDESLSADEMMALQAAMDNRVNSVQFEKLVTQWCNREYKKVSLKALNV
ncbi:hypothetical protein LXL04_019852 [Taraxacum kok-saghyz]